MDAILDALIELMRWPYDAWKQSIENSRLGASEFDRKTLRFWKGFAILGSALLIAIGIIGGLLGWW